MENPMSAQQLPEPFHDLAPYLAWALPTERERSAKRYASTMADLRAFYDAMLGRMTEVLPYLARFAPGNVPADVQRLFYLALSLAEIAPAVENFGQPNVVEGSDSTRFVPVHE